MIVKKKLLQLICLIAATVLSSCLSTQPVIRNLQSVQIEGGIPANAIHIIDDRQEGKTEITPYMRLNRNRRFSARLDGHTMVNEEGVFETIETAPEEYIEQANVNIFPFEGTNFHWEQPAYQAGIDIVVPVSPLVGFTLAFETAKLNSKSTQSLGLGFNFAIIEKRWSGEINGMLRAQKLHYSAEVVEIEDKQILGNETRRVQFISIESRSIYFNPSVSITINGRDPQWLIHPFANAELGKLDLTRLHENLPEETITTPVSSSPSFDRSDLYVNVAGGVYFKLTAKQKVLFGIRRKGFIGPDNIKPVIDSFIQLTLTLGK